MIMDKNAYDAYKRAMKAHGDHEALGIFDTTTCDICNWEHGRPPCPD